MALLGFCFPYLFIIQVIFLLIFWKKQYKGLLYCALAMLIISFANMRNYLQISTTSFQKEDFKVLSYNVHYFDYLFRNKLVKDRTENLKIVLDELAQENADILCLQEFSGATKALTQSAHEYMLQTLKYPYFYKGGKSSLAIYSKFPLKAGKTIHFENSFNGGISAIATIGKTEVKIYNVHLQSIKLGEDAEHILEKQDLSKKQADATKEKYWRIGGKLRKAFILRTEQVKTLDQLFVQDTHTTILAGDFNDTPISYTYNMMSKYFYDSFVQGGWGFGSTYAGNLPWLRIDYIMATPMLKIHWHKVIKTAKASDHYPISVGFSLERE